MFGLFEYFILMIISTFISHGLRIQVTFTFFLFIGLVTLIIFDLKKNKKWKKWLHI